MVLVRVLIVLVLVVGGLVLTGFGWTLYQDHQFDVQQAVEVEGTVESSDVERTGWTFGSTDAERNDQETDRRDFRPVVRYTYTYEGTEYTSESVYPGPEKQFNNEEDARRIADWFSPGETTTVYVNQEDPSRAFLIERPHFIRPFLYMGIGGLLAVGGVGNLGKGIVGGEGGG